jgi:cytochrome b561
MSQPLSATRYRSGLIALHWLMLVLIIGVYAAIEFRVLYPRGSNIREGLKTLHFVLGLTIFVLVWLRLVLRLTGRVPPIAPAPPRWQLWIANIVEAAMYVFMIVMPLLGWLTLSASGDVVSLWGAALPAPIGADDRLAEQLEEIHVTIGNAGYALIALHTLAALVHHYVQRDNTLKRMLPS